MLNLVAVEEQTQRIGKELFAQVKEESVRFFRSEHWTARLLEWAMRHEDLKVKLFRFVDVLPTLGDDTSVVRHLEEYFGGDPDPFRGLLKMGLSLAGAGRFGARAAAATLRRGVEQVARSFIAGSTIDEVLKVIEEFHQQRQGSTIDVLGEATLSEEEADVYQQRYLELLTALMERTPHWPAVEQVDQAPWGRLPRANISVKLSALYSQLDPIDLEQGLDPVDLQQSEAGVMTRLWPILQRAREHSVHIQLDMEDYHLKDLTLHILRHIGESPDFRDYRPLGIVLQAYLLESEEDARQLIAWARHRGTPLTVRLVKGAYWDFETVHAHLEGWPVPVYEHKWETDASFERITRLFLENRDCIDLAIGSHNIRSIAHALALAQELNVPPRTLEFQFLYGMATPLRRTLARKGERVRVYTPYGALIPGMAYLVRRLLENTSNESFLRQGFVEQESPEKLLRNPVEIGRERREPVKDKVAQQQLTAANNTQRYGGWEAGPEFGLPPYHNEPLTNFAHAQARQRMMQAIEEVRGTLGGFYPLIIGHDALKISEELVSLDPSQPSRVIGRTGRATAAQAEQAVAVAAKASPAWQAKPARQRVEILRQAAAIMRRRRLALAALICLEAGKPWREADADVCEAIDFIEWYARQALYLAEPQPMANLTGEINHYLYEPRGVAAVIAPWNFPLAILTGMSSAALVSGNTVILKPAEQTPVIAAKLVEIYREAGIPAGVINYLPGMGEVGAALVRHAQVHVIAFTGSKTVGLEILRTAAETQPGQRHIKQAITEMGGKNAIIVDDDADLDETVAGVTSSAFGYAGQKCSAASRVIVLERIYDAFLDRLIKATRSLITGAAWEPATFVGPVIEDEARQRILTYIEQGHKEGKPMLLQEVPEALQKLGGYYVMPTIFTDVSRKATIACEEIFGPVLTVMRAQNFDEAIDIAMDSDYKLTGGIFSRSPARIQRARQEFRVGNLYINRRITGARVGRQPFGGLGLSGAGFQSGGPDYLKQFVKTRVVTENTLRRGFADDFQAGE